MPKHQTLNLDDLLAATKIGETDDCEFKSAKGGLPRSMWETYSAMANTIGGKIVLGVSERDGVFKIDGIPQKQISEFKKLVFDNLNNRQKVSRNLLTPSDLSILSVNGTQVLVLNIRPADRTERPVYLKNNPLGNTYRRYHEGDYVCSDEETRRMLADADPQPADHRVLEHFNHYDIDADSLNQYRNIFASRSPEHPWLTEDKTDFLRMLGAWGTDRETEKSGLTVAGLLMFGKNQSIIDAAAFPKFFLDYRERFDPNERWTDRIYPDGTWEANLFQFYRRVWPKLIADIPIPFELRDGERIPETPAHKALREALVNALVHTDYTAPGNIVIELHRGKFVLENPGTMLVSLEQLKRGGVSECRNSSLQKMFVMIGGGERAGSGYHQIQKGWKEAGWRTPHLTTQFHPDRVILVMPSVSLIPDATLSLLHELFGAKIDHLNQTQILILSTANIEGEVTNARMQELLSDHPSDITQTLRDLCKSGYLVSDEKRRWTRYRLAQHKPDDLFSHPKGGELEPKGGELEPKGGELEPKGGELEPKGGELEPKGGELEPKGGELEPKGGELEPKGGELEPKGGELEPKGGELEPKGGELIWNELLTIAAKVRDKGKVSKSVMQSTTLELCSDRFLTLQELAELLGRNSKRLRDVHLSQMVKDGQLQLKHPDQLNHPGQAYTAA